MERALVIGASGGIGSAFTAELQSRGVVADGLSRSVDGLDITDGLTSAQTGRATTTPGGKSNGYAPGTHARRSSDRLRDCAPAGRR